MKYKNWKEVARVINKKNTDAARQLDKLKIKPVTVNTRKKNYRAVSQTIENFEAYVYPHELNYKKASFDMVYILNIAGLVVQLKNDLQNLTIKSRVQVPDATRSDDYLDMPYGTRREISKFIAAQYRDSVLNGIDSKHVREFSRTVIKEYIYLFSKKGKHSDAQKRRFVEVNKEWATFVFKKI